MLNAGLLRIALAGLVALSLGAFGVSVGGAYLAAGLGAILGLSLVLGHPKILSRGVFALVLLDSLLISLLVFSTGGQSSPFFLLYFLAALEIAWVSNVARAFAGAVAVVGGYLAVAGFSSGGLEALLSPEVGLRAGIVALVCGGAGLLGAELRGARENGRDRSSDLAAERAYGEEVAALVSKFGPVLAVLGPDEVLRWTAEAVRESLKVPYAHVAMLDGVSHQTAVQGDHDAYPGWWHPTIQRLVLWSCRTGEVHRSEDVLHGIEGFVSVPISADGERMGAVIAGGPGLGPEEERVLKLLAAQAASALKSSGEAPGGRDPAFGLPNRSSLRHVLQRELSRDRALTVMMLDLGRFRRYSRSYGPTAVDALLRTLEGGLGDNKYRMFGYESDKLVAILAGSDESKAREKAARVRHSVEALTAGSAVPLDVSVGFAVTEPGDRDPDLVLGAALSALGESKSRPERIAGSPAFAGYRGAGSLRGVKVSARDGEAIQALVQAVEHRAPHVGEHSNAVSNIARHLGHRMALPREQMDVLILGSLLHDVGKIGLPDSILNKPGPLTEEEQKAVKRHPVLGAEIVEPIRGLSSLLPAIRHHHERFDGRGYPDGLRGEEIPLVARVIFVADALDSMVRDRPYRQGISEEAALEEIMRNAGTQFDPDVARVLVELVRESDSWRISSAG